MSFRKQERKILVVATSPSPKPILQNGSRRSYSSFIKSDHCKNKNIIMNELSLDTGYPQQILIPRKVKQKEEQQSKNYLRQNIRKMADYGPGCVPLSKLNVDKGSGRLDPSRILLIKKTESNLKDETKITLSKQITIPSCTHSTMKLHRMEQVLQFNDKVSDMRQTFSVMTPNRNQSRQRPRSSVHRLTQSSLNKRCLTAKKRAYVEVFGDQTGSPQKNPEQLKLTKETVSHKRMSGKEVRAAQKAKLVHDSMRFQKIIGKLSALNQIFNGAIQEKQLENQVYAKVNQQFLSQQLLKTEQDQMFNQVRQFANKDKVKKYNRGYSKLANLNDLEKIDPKFCEQFRRHKEKKVLKMKYDLQLCSLKTPKFETDLHSTSSIEVLVPTQLDSSFLEDNRQMKDSPPLKDRQWMKPIRYMSQYEKTQNFLRNFFRVKQQGDKFGISIELMYEGLYTRPTVPFALEGSYLFFKAIEQENILTIQNMIKMQPTIVFQIDDEGRTPLIYAAQKNILSVVKILLKIGVNQDALSFREVNALYYAIRNRNISMVFELLYAGCSPWSPSGSDFTHLLKDPEPNNIRSLLQLARRVSIVVKLVKYSARLQVWRVQRQLIKKMYDPIQ